MCVEDREGGAPGTEVSARSMMRVRYRRGRGGGLRRVTSPIPPLVARACAPLARTAWRTDDYKCAHTRQSWGGTQGGTRTGRGRRGRKRRAEQVGETRIKQWCSSPSPRRLAPARPTCRGDHNAPGLAQNSPQARGYLDSKKHIRHPKVPVATRLAPASWRQRDGFDGRPVERVRK